MSDVLMPSELTAENGAKKALIGEFYEEIELQCIECLHGCDESEGCEVCGGEGEYLHKVPVSWTTTKAIYKKAVETVGKDASHVAELRDALKLAVEALTWNTGGEPMPTMELEAINKGKAILDKLEGKS